MRRLIIAFCASLLCVAGFAQSYKELVQQGLSQMQNDSLTEAENSFRQAMKSSPAQKSNALLFRYIGQIQERTNRESDALESYSLGINIAADNVDLLMDRASLYLRLDNLDRAIADYTKVLDIKEDYADAMFFRAYLYTKKRDFKNARIDYERLLRLQPSREDALQGLVLLNDKDGRPREAMEQINYLIQIYPSHALNYVIRGGMEQQRKQYEAAVFDFEKAMQLEPLNPEHVLSRAACYIEMRRKKLARADLSLALKLGADKTLVNNLYQMIK